ncbi:MAG TPA: SgcJ/EcaC family oxidoreductase [Candidatus Eisenbacteria bacterium]|nr:SgcJ/EcaC family oxidoreductase [Candidatus Eisenbacteria bacterium]
MPSARWSIVPAVLVATVLALASPVLARGTAADSTAIHGIVAELDSAWARGDAGLWASHYAPDAEFINILGMLFPDVKSMQARHHEIFQGVFRGSRHQGFLRRLRFLGSDAAVADVDVSVTGYKALPPGSRASEPGVLRTRMKHVLARTNGVWRIVSSQNTAVAPNG